uniref:Uncharacterized protein n=1 Tax=Rhizophora mucronata TaxID=61149 RepID=A0A2P2NZV0_RHIMU
MPEEKFHIKIIQPFTTCPQHTKTVNTLNQGKPHNVCSNVHISCCAFR